MRWYAVVELEITDRGWVREYVDQVTRLVTRYGGRYLARTGRVERFEGEPAAPQLYVLIEWPSQAAAALAFYERAEYRPYRERRQTGSRGTFTLVAGEDVGAGPRPAGAPATGAHAVG